MDPELLAVVTGLVMLIGLAGTVIPILPGLVVIWGAAVVYGIASGFDVVAWIAIAVITALFATALWLAVKLPQRRTADAGVSLALQFFALGIAVVGYFAIPVVGAPLGFVAGIFLGRMATTRDAPTAWASTKAALVGMFHAASVQFIAGVLMILVWLAWAIFG
jgi:uncharacterized protein YqgC (DUF456 family)